MLNAGDFFGIPSVDSMVNEGTGYNYGLELTVEKFLSRNYYVLLTGSLFDSKYKGYDGIDPGGLELAPLVIVILPRQV